MFFFLTNNIFVLKCVCVTSLYVTLSCCLSFSGFPFSLPHSRFSFLSLILLLSQVAYGLQRPAAASKTLEFPFYSTAGHQSANAIEEHSPLTSSHPINSS